MRPLKLFTSATRPDTSARMYPAVSSCMGRDGHIIRGSAASGMVHRARGASDSASCIAGGILIPGTAITPITITITTIPPRGHRHDRTIIRGGDHGTSMRHTRDSRPVAMAAYPGPGGTTLLISMIGGDTTMSPHTGRGNGLHHPVRRQEMVSRDVPVMFR